MDESIRRKIGVEVLRETEQSKSHQKNYKPSNDSLYNQGAKDFANHFDHTEACKYYLLCNGYR